MKEEKLKTEYEKLKTRYNFILQIKNARKEQNITQEKLALCAGTKKSNISRLESGKYNPSIDFITKVVKCLGKEMDIIIK